MWQLMVKSFYHANLYNIGFKEFLIKKAALELTARYKTLKSDNDCGLISCV